MTLEAPTISPPIGQNWKTTIQDVWKKPTICEELQRFSRISSVLTVLEAVPRSEDPKDGDSNFQRYTVCVNKSISLQQVFYVIPFGNEKF